MKTGIEMRWNNGIARVGQTAELHDGCSAGSLLGGDSETWIDSPTLEDRGTVNGTEGADDDGAVGEEG